MADQAQSAEMLGVNRACSRYLYQVGEHSPKHCLACGLGPCKNVLAPPENVLAPSQAADPLRIAAAAIADLFCISLMQNGRTRDREAAFRGDAEQLFACERQALLWLRQQWDRDQGTRINAWTAQFVDAIHPREDASPAQPLPQGP